jgi:tRNA1Val (adenine37-N6)-methyltransferase
MYFSLGISLQYSKIMGRNKYFQFRQFKIVQEKSAMKVGTDGVLLGAWVNTGSAQTILDVGTGTGLIALMLAQRSDAAITALEIEKNSFDEACFNFGQSPWAARITPVNQSFQEFCSTPREKFDLIVSNPPFFENSTKAPGKPRSDARHTDLLPYRDLVEGSAKLLTGYGRLSVIIPADASTRFVSVAESVGLVISRVTRVRSKPDKPFHRFLIEFSKEKNEPEIGELAIEQELRHQFTPEYKNLTKEFYLLF